MVLVDLDWIQEMENTLQPKLMLVSNFRVPENFSVTKQKEQPTMW